MLFFQIFLVSFVVMPSLGYAMEDEPDGEKEKYTLLIKKQDALILEYKERRQPNQNKEKNAQALFDAYMQKAAFFLFHTLGIREPWL